MSLINPSTMINHLRMINNPYKFNLNLSKINSTPNSYNNKKYSMMIKSTSINNKSTVFKKKYSKKMR